MLKSIGREPRGEPTLAQLLLDCHARIRYFLALGRRIVQDGHAPGHEIASACEAVRDYFVRALPLHVRDEEESILPRLRGRTEAVDAALAAMCAQHHHHEQAIAELLAALAQVRLTPEQRPRDALHAALHPLACELEEHLALEEATILPALSMLAHDEQAEVIRELRARRA